MTCHRTASWIGLALGCAVLAGCSSRPAPSGLPSSAPTPYPPARSQTVDGLPPEPAAAPPAPGSSPDTVAAEALAVMFRWDTGRDSGPATATRRALAFLAPPMSSAVITSPPVASPGAQWNTWAAHHATLTPAITPGSDDRPPDTADQAYRQFEITQAVHSPDGWSAPPQHATAFVTLVHTAAGWKITDVRQE
jgi:hypothetical protein